MLVTIAIIIATFAAAIALRMHIEDYAAKQPEDRPARHIMVAGTTVSVLISVFLALFFSGIVLLPIWAVFDSSGQEKLAHAEDLTPVDERAGSHIYYTSTFVITDRELEYADDVDEQYDYKVKSLANKRRIERYQAETEDEKPVKCIIYRQYDPMVKTEVELSLIRVPEDVPIIYLEKKPNDNE